MRGEHGDESDGAATGLVQDGAGLRAVDDGGVPGGRVDEEVGVVVGKLRDRDYFHVA